MMKKFILIFFLICAKFSFAQKDSLIYKWDYIDHNKNGIKDIYEDPLKSINERTQDLLSRMNIDEKVAQLCTLYGYGAVLKDRLPTNGWKDSLWKYGIGNIDEQLTGLRMDTILAYPYSAHAEALDKIQRWFIENTRLGIPVDFTTEGIRGLNHMKATYFPSQLAQACSFDRNLAFSIGDITGKEAKLLGYSNVYSPILDVASDPRWGRIEESYGCEPYLVGQLGKQQILGIQRNGVASTVKHFAVYSVPIGGRDGNVRANPQITPREMWEIYLEPFRVAIQEASPLGVMASYNDYDGEPIIGSYHFLTEILRNAFRFSGYIVSDSEAFEYLYSKHHVVKDATEAAALALHAGLNVRTNFDQPKVFISSVKKAIDKGLLSVEDLDKRVSEVLLVKFKLGLFDHLLEPNSSSINNKIHTEEAQKLSLKAAHESIVLLKNKNILPLQKKQNTKIAVIGPNAAEVKSLYSRYGPVKGPIISVLEGLKQKLKDKATIQYCKGIDHRDPHFPTSDIQRFDLNSSEKKGIDSAVNIARNADVVILVVGDDDKTVGEFNSRSSLKLPGHQYELINAVLTTNKRTILVHIGGRPASMEDVYNKVDAAIETFYLGEKTGEAIADVLFGDYNPGGKLCVPILKDVGQIPLTFPLKLSDDAGGNASVSGFLFPFGYGLSYTKFAYTDLKIKYNPNSTKDSIEISFKLKNIGNYDGDAVPQLYIKDVVASLVPYDKKLKEFQRVNLKVGEQKNIYMKIPYDAFAMYNKAIKRVVEEGDFAIMLGESSEDIQLKEIIHLKGSVL